MFRSNANMYVQVIDDDSGHTLVAASSLEGRAGDRATGLQGNEGRVGDRATDLQGKKTDKARAVGRLAAERAKAKGITKVVFDRGGYLYHGRVKAVAEGARSGGLEF